MKKILFSLIILGFISMFNFLHLQKEEQSVPSQAPMQMETFVENKELIVTDTDTVNTEPIIPEILFFNNQQITIHPVGLTEDGAMDTVDSATDIAWYSYAPINENIILAAHRYFGGEKGVFFNLENTDQEKITIKFSDGSKKTFRLDSLNSYEVDKVPSDVMNIRGENRVTLITCDGYYNPVTTNHSKRAVAVYK